MNSLKKNHRDMLGRHETVSLTNAFQLLSANLPPCPDRVTSLPLTDSLGRICAEDILSMENLPAYPRSTMDGYAVRSKETFGASEKLPAYLEISGSVSMGEYPEHGPEPGCCYAIATGGLLPPGTDAVVMLEHTVSVDGSMIEVVQAVAAGTNIIDIGEDIAQNAVLLPAGHRLRPQDIGLLAGVGIVNITVYRRPRVGIISTGDEIVPHDQQPPPGKIRDMNSVSLSAQVRDSGALPTFYGIAVDSEENLTAMMQRALKANDIVLFSGSSSVGSRDLGETVIEKTCVPGIIIHGVSIKPGKPVIIARADEKIVFGLPGHPVSAAVCFDQFVKPAINHFSGIADTGLPHHKTVAARLMRNLNSAAGRTDFVRVEVKINGGGKPEAYPILGKSGALSTMVKAHGFIKIAEKVQGLNEGETVKVMLFD